MQGYAGTPVNVNGIMFDYRATSAPPAPCSRARALLRRRRLAARPLHDKSLDGQYVLRSWVNDLRAAARAARDDEVAAGRPTIALRATDSQSGVDPFSLVFGYQSRRRSSARRVYDPVDAASRSSRSRRARRR